MRVKYSVIPFIPAFLAMMFLKLMSLFGLDGNGLFLGMNAMNITYAVIGVCVGLFVVCVIINIFDRKTSPVYPVKKNVAAGALSLIGGAMVIASAAARFSAALSNSLDSEYFMMIVICAIFSLPAGIALMLISKVHFQGKSIVSNVSILFVFPALWGCAELVTEFLMATKASIYSRDLTSMFCYIFLTLYLFSNSMIVSRIKGRNPVKSCFIYGLPAVSVSLTFGVYEICRLMREGFEYSSMLAAIQFIILGLYAASFIAELFANSYTKDEFEVIDGLPVDARTINRLRQKRFLTKREIEILDRVDSEMEYMDTKEYEDLVFTEPPEEREPNVEVNDDYYANAKGMDDFIMGYQDEVDDDEPVPYFNKHEQAKGNDSLIMPNEVFDEDYVGEYGLETKTKKSVDNAKQMLDNVKNGKKSDSTAESDETAKAKKSSGDAKKSEQSHVDAVNEQFENVTRDEKKDDDYYEKRLNEINNLLKDLEK